MNMLKLNWIKFFHNSHTSVEIMQKLYNYISELSPGIYITIEDISSNTLTSSNDAIMIIKSLIESNLLILDLKCPVCNEHIELSDELLSNCIYCETEININTLPIAIVSLEASLVNILKNKINEKSYETNAELLSKLVKENGILYYLITDIVDSQILQKTEPNHYSMILEKLWIDLWPRILYIVKKVSLPLLARGDAVSWVFANKDDLLNAIEEIYNYLNLNPIAKLSIYGSELIIPNDIKNPFMRSLDMKWDLNTPSVTDLYRKSTFKPSIWEDSNSYVLKYCLFDELAKEHIDSDDFSFIKNCVLIDYKTSDKHDNIYTGKCLAGYCETK